MAPIKYTPTGRVLVDPVGDVVSWTNGLPFTAEGALAIAAADPEGFVNGVPMADDRVATGEAE